MQPTLPKGFITLEEFMELIKTDTRSNPTVDTTWMVRHIDWVEENHNFRIPLIKLSADKTRNVRIGSKFVAVRDAYDRESIKRLIRDHFRDLAGHEYRAQTVRAVSSVADDEVGSGVRPRKVKPIAKEGDAIGTGETVTTNGKGM